MKTNFCPFLLALAIAVVQVPTLMAQDAGATADAPVTIEGSSIQDAKAQDSAVQDAAASPSDAPGNSDAPGVAAEANQPPTGVSQPQRSGGTTSTALMRRATVARSNIGQDGELRFNFSRSKS